MPIIDPEFPFDIEAIRLKIKLSRMYPKTYGPNFEVLNDNIPLHLRRNIEECMKKEIKPGELCIRPILRFLQNNIESMLVDTPIPNVCGIKFVAPSAIILDRKPSAKVDSSENEEVILQTEAILDDVSRLSNSSVSEVSSIRSCTSESRFKPGVFFKLEPINTACLIGSIQTVGLRGRTQVSRTSETSR